MKATVAERGQVTIPKALRERLGIKPHTVLAFHVEKGRLIAEKSPSEDSLAGLIGCIKLDRPTDELIAEMRDPE